MSSWKRSHDFGGNFSTAFDHNTILKIENLLKERSECKLAKKYSRADEISCVLKDMNICYHDDKREWYYKAPTKKMDDCANPIHPGTSSVGSRSEIVSSMLTNAKKKERNRRQAEKNRKKKRDAIEGMDIEVKSEAKRRRKE